jgi:prepilin-type N-terminal cleavage/methylation domain-containing protein
MLRMYELITNKIKFYKQFNAFTLAEVLITLLVIGVVASMVIPNIIADQQNVQYTIGLKKAIGTLNNGFRLIMANAGCSDITCVNILNASTDITVTNIKNAGVFKVFKKCNKNETGCHDKLLVYLNNDDAWIVGANYSTIILDDGTTIGFAGAIDPNCNNNWGTGKLSNICSLYLIVDINGEKKPNKFGRDVFRMYLVKSGEVVPAGMKNDTYYGYWQTSNNGCYIEDSSGEDCAARIMEEGWEMNY